MPANVIVLLMIIVSNINACMLNLLLLHVKHIISGGMVD